MNLDMSDYFPIPDLLKTPKILCIQSHPDDMEIGAGATIARLVDEGAQVSCLTITDGSIGTTDHNLKPEALVTIRQEEAKKSSEIIGVRESIWLGFPDGGSLDLKLVRSHITRTIRLLKPSAVVVNDPWLQYEAHSDHTITGLAAAEACLLANMPHFYPEHLKENLEPHQVNIVAFYYSANPNTFIDVSKTWDKKMSALACHTSQFPGDMLTMIQTYLTQKARIHGENNNCNLAEAFKVLTPQHLHICENAWRY